MDRSIQLFYRSAQKYNFAINDQGNVELSIDYIGWLEASYDDGDSDVLATEQILRNRLIRRETITRVINEDPCDTEKIGRLENEFKAAIDRENYGAWQRLLTTLDEQDRVFYIPVPADQLENYYDAQRGGASIRGLWNQIVGASSIGDVDFSLRSSGGC